MKKYPPPPRKKVHWDYLLEEMNWLAIDFTQERRWKMALANHLAKTIVAYHETQDKSMFLFKVHIPCLIHLSFDSILFLSFI